MDVIGIGQPGVYCIAIIHPRRNRKNTLQGIAKAIIARTDWS
jgi:hypothetical protein